MEDKLLSIQHDEKGQVVIGEAALALALSEKEISLNTLIMQLSRMEAGCVTDERIQSIVKARNWLMSFEHPQEAAACLPYLNS
ncbi:hypothetical protein ACFSKS_09115 [Pseudocitrobacter faecalis]